MIVVVARHAEYDESTGSLNVNGIQRAHSLAKEIHENYPARPVRILSSHAPRAQETAVILAEPYNSEVETHEVLFSYGKKPDIEAILQLIEANKSVEVLILVVHLEGGEHLPPAILQRFLGIQRNPRVLEKGHAFVIDVDRRRMSIL